MAAYVQDDGERLTLTYHTPAEWADEVTAKLITLGCSPEYAGRRAALIRTATPPGIVAA